MLKVSFKSIFRLVVGVLVLFNSVLNPIVLAMAPANDGGNTMPVQEGEAIVDDNSADTEAPGSLGGDQPQQQESQQSTSSDATVVISCILDGEQFDLNNLPSNSEFACGERIECGVWFKNMGADATENFVGTVTVGGGTIDHLATATTPGVSCSQVGNDTYECTGSVTNAHPEDLILFVDLPTCDCEETFSFGIDGAVSASNDTNTSNNTANHGVTYGGPVCAGTTECTDTTLDVTTVELGDDDFTVTCAGSDADSFSVAVVDTATNQLVATSPQLTDNDNNDEETWTWTPTAQGTYSFTCAAFGSNGQSDTCTSVTGYVTETQGCQDPVNLSITSHQDGDTVATDTILLAGTIGSSCTEVTVNGSSVVTNGNTWSEQVQLVPGANTFVIDAEHCNPFCSESQTIIINYVPTVVTTTCTETELNPTVVTLGNGDFAVTCRGENVDKYMVTVVDAATNQVVAISPQLMDNDNNDEETWTWTPSSTGTYEFTCAAWGEGGDDTCPMVTGTVISAQCTDPITLTITSHQNGATVATDTITLAGSVDPNYSVVTVDGSSVTMVGNTWSEQVQLVPGANTFFVQATNNDPLCDVGETITINYVPTVVTTTCTETELNPTVVTLGNGDFAVTCRGENVDKYMVTVVDGATNQVVTTSPQLMDTDNNDEETWTWTPSSTGTYEFTCAAWGEGGDDTCPMVTGTVISAQCTDPIGVFDLDSHQNGQVVTTDTITLQGNIDPSYAVVTVNGQQATVTGNNWFEQVSLTVGLNQFTIVANTTDPLCEESITVTIVYQPTSPQVVCTETEVNPTVVTLGNGNFDVTCSGVNVDYFVVHVTENGQTIAISTQLMDNDNNDQETWTWTPSSTGTYEFTCNAFGYGGQDQCDSEQGTVVDVPNETQCTETEVNPAVVTLGNGDFAVTCRGENVDKYMVTVVDAATNQVVTTSPQLMDNDNNDEETWTWTPSTAGTYEFTCVAWGEGGDDKCPTSTGVVKEIQPSCIDPITQLTVENYTNGQTVTTNTVVLRGVVEPAGATVTVTLPNGQLVNAVVTGTSWEATVPLTQGLNDFVIVADPADNYCAPEKRSLVLNYQPDHTVSTCNETNVTPSVVTLGGNEDFIVTCSGENIDSYRVEVSQNGTLVATSPLLVDSDGNDIESWAWTPTAAGTFDFRCLSWGSYNDPVCPSDTGTVLVDNVEVECTETNVTPSTVDLTSGDDFTVTCSGKNIERYMVTVKLNGNVLGNSPILVDTDNNDIEAWQYSPTQAGNYQFTCMGWASGGEYVCPSDSGVVTHTTNQCEDPIGLVITKPVNNSRFSGNRVIVEGSVTDTSATVKINGDTVTIASDGTFEKEIIYTSNGTYDIKVTATTGDSDCDEEKTVTVTRRRSTGGRGGRTSSISCGNGRIDRSYEQCDDGNVRSGDGCSASCQIEDEPVCGNGITEIGEQCDDGNVRSGDGCSALCRLEEEEVVVKVKEVKKRPVLRPQPVTFMPIKTPVVLPKTGRLERFAPLRRTAR